MGKTNHCTLIHLEQTLREKGILQRAIRHEFDARKRKLVVWYYDRLLQETFLVIARTSPLCFYVLLDGEKEIKLTKRTAGELIEFLDVFMAEQRDWSDFKKWVDATPLALNRFYHSTNKQRAIMYKDWFNKNKNSLKE